MITQKELKGYLDTRRRVQRLEKRKDVADYLATQRSAAETLASIRKRFESGEQVQAGPFHFVREVATSPVVSYEKFWGALLAIPAVALTVLNSELAQVLVQQLRRRDPSAEFIGKRNAVTVDVLDTTPVLGAE